MHDFKSFPELRNNQMADLYFESPHRQIGEDFLAQVVKVTDGDTIRVTTNFRDFDFPIRLSNIAAAEMDEEGGLESRSTLASLIDGAEVQIVIDPNNRVGKWGRLIGEVIAKGMNINEEMMRRNAATDFATRKMSTIPSFEKQLEAFAI